MQEHELGYRVIDSLTDIQGGISLRDRVKPDQDFLNQSNGDSGEGNK